jgi:hypothetical protein
MMPELNFPSGPWTGFYNYGPGIRKHRMDLAITFSKTNIFGSGSDDVARFFITGHYDRSTGECYWTKAYVGAHDVYYRGFRDGKGIWGPWELANGSGGFHIWPLGEGDGERQSETVAESTPVEAIALQTA